MPGATSRGKLNTWPNRWRKSNHLYRRNTGLNKVCTSKLYNSCPNLWIHRLRVPQYRGSSLYWQFSWTISTSTLLENCVIVKLKKVPNKKKQQIDLQAPRNIRSSLVKMYRFLWLLFSKCIIPWSTLLSGIVDILQVKVQGQMAAQQKA